MKRVVLFPSESAIIVSLVKYPAIVQKRTTVIDKQSEKNWKMSPPLFEIMASTLK